MKGVGVAALSVLIVSGLWSCSDEGRLSEGKTADVLADLALAEAYAQNNVEYMDDSSRNALRASVLSSHSVTQEELDATLSWYGHHLEKYAKLSDLVAKRLDKKQKHLVSTGNDDAKGGSQSEIWPYSPMAMLTDIAGRDALTFSIPTDGVGKGESLTWAMKLTQSVPLQMTLGVDYKEGGTSYTSRRFSGQNRVELALTPDTTKRVSRIYGVMRVGQEAGLPLWADSISLTHNGSVGNDYYRAHGQQYDYDGPHKKKTTQEPRRTIQPISDNVRDAQERPGMSNMNHELVPTERPGTTR